MQETADLPIRCGDDGAADGRNGHSTRVNMIHGGGLRRLRRCRFSTTSTPTDHRFLRAHKMTMAGAVLPAESDDLKPILEHVRNWARSHQPAGRTCGPILWRSASLISKAGAGSPTPACRAYRNAPRPEAHPSFFSPCICSTTFRTCA